ncbi:MAG: MATE family efflux transporter [Phycisphaerales bacterium]|nr:MATE family efflux transporter [Phycisphaerales bacterium]
MSTPPNASAPMERHGELTEPAESPPDVGCAPGAADLMVAEGAPVERIRTGRLAGLGMWASIWVLSWPILLDSVMNWLVGAVDTVLAAGVSEAATDGIGGGAYIVWFIAMMGMSLGVGATALVSRSVGKGRKAVANAAVGQAVTLGAILGVLTGALVAAAAPLMGTLLGLSPEAHRSMTVYLWIVALAAPAVTVMEVGIACCRGAGDSFRPLIIMALVNAVNVLVSWALAGVDLTRTVVNEAGEKVTTVILVNPFSFDMGVAGIAIGTVAAWSVGAVAALALLVDGRAGVRLMGRRLRPHWITMGRLIRQGVPNFLEILGMWAGNFLVIMMVGWMMSPGLLGAHIVAIRIEAISFLPGFAMSMAAATLVGQWLGAGSVRMAERTVWACAWVSAVFMGVRGLALIVFARPITGLFSPQDTHLEVTPKLLFICGIVQVPFALGMVFRSALRGAGDARVVMWLTWITTWGVRLPLAFFLSGVDPVIFGKVYENPSPFDWGLTGLWWGLCLELVVRGAAFTGRFLQGKWKTKRV